MKIGKYILTSLLFVGSFTTATAQDDECTRFKAIAGDAYSVKNYEKVTIAYYKAMEECETLELKFYNPFLYSIKQAKKNAESKEDEAKYLDTLIEVYHRAQATHGLQKDWQSYLGYSYLTQGKPGYMEKADEAFVIGVHHEGKDVNKGFLQHYYANLYNLWVQEKDEKKKDGYKKRIINEFFQLSEYLTADGEDTKSLDFISIYLNKVITDCAIILPSIRNFLSELPQEVENKKKMVNNFMELLEKKKCTDSDEYAMLVDTVIAIDPSVGAKLAKAKLQIARGNSSGAISTFKAALDMTDDADEVSDIELEIARAYFNNRSYKSAHNAGLAVSGKNSEDGYSIAAKSVYAMRNDCGGSTFERKANNYYAVELAEKAGDSKLASIYKDQCPSQNDLFNESIKEGDEVKLDCWGKTYQTKLY